MKTEFNTRKLGDRWLLRFIRVRHFFFGPWMGCSCSRCFWSKHRIVHGQELIQINQRLAKIDDELRNCQRIYPR